MPTTYTGVSQIKLGGIPLDIDPDDYGMVGGARRGSTHRTIAGGTVIQDRGFVEADQRIVLTGRLTSLTTLKGLYALYRTTGTMTFEDYKGNAYTVVFVPGMDSFIFKPIRGSNIGYEYTMHLQVVTVTKRLGDTV